MTMTDHDFFSFWSAPAHLSEASAPHAAGSGSDHRGPSPDPGPLGTGGGLTQCQNDGSGTGTLPHAR